MAEPKAKSPVEREKQIRNDAVFMMLMSIVLILLWGWLRSIDAVAWLHPFLLQGSIVFSIMFIIHCVMMDMFKYGFKQ